MKSEVLRARNLTLSRNGEKIISNISLSLYKGEILGVAGINGVGKTLLAQIFAGIMAPDSGHIFLDDAELNLRSPRDAIRGKIGYVSEEPQLLPNMTVAENLIIGLDKNPKLYYSRHALYENARRILKYFEFDINPKAMPPSLSYFQMKEVQVARQLAARPRVLVFDGVANSFSESETANLKRTFERAAKDGAAIIYATHNYEDAIRLTDRILVLRNACIVAELPKENFDKDTLRHLMYGKTAPGWKALAQNTAAPPGREVFRVERLSAGTLESLSFSVALGEILGITELTGNGKSVLAECLAGGLPMRGGTVWVEGVRRKLTSPRDAQRSGIGLYFERRERMLLSDCDPVYMNISQGVLSRISSLGVLSRKKEELLAREYCERFGVDNDIGQNLGRLNSAALAKIALARCMAGNPRVLILNEPNRELDSESVLILRDILEEIRKTCGIVIIFSKIDPLVQCCDRTLVIRGGRSPGEIAGDRLSYEEIIRLTETEGDVQI
ncbi:MAG TPA: hypothetical protein DEQ02_05735 [Ruminococcaceae bacterium]|nr:hypothetical protein [Oscillospiraceae bacterium]